MGETPRMGNEGVSLPRALASAALLRGPVRSGRTGAAHGLVARLRRHLVLVAYLVLVAAMLFGIYRVETIANRTNASLCSFKADLERRVEATREFLLRNPEGIPGISRAEFERSLASQESTIASLGSLHC